jgi:hypothetical protein
LLVALTVPRTAFADRGALTLDVGAGGTVLALRAPYAPSSGPAPGLSFLASLGLRYALENWVEIEASSYVEPPVTYFHNGVAVRAPGGPFRGTLKHRFYRYGALLGGRVVSGKVWRVLAAADVGWSHRAYSGFQHIDDSHPNAPRDFGLSLPDFTLDNWVLCATAGIEWAEGDRWSVSFLPRYEQLLGASSTFALSARLFFSFSWYL